MIRSPETFILAGETLSGTGEVAPPTTARQGGRRFLWTRNLLSRKGLRVAPSCGAAIRRAMRVSISRTDPGKLKVSTALMGGWGLLRYPLAARGIDIVTTVLSDLGGEIDPSGLAALPSAASGPASRAPAGASGHANGSIHARRTALALCRG